MRRNRLIYFVVFAACLVFSICYRSRLTAVLLCAAALYPLLALVFTALSLLFISAGYIQPRGSYEKKAPFELVIYLKNRFIFAYAPVELICTLPDADTGLFSSRRIYASLSPFSKSKISVSCMHRYRGCYVSEISRLSVYDPFRIIRLSKKVRAEMTLVFLPRKIPLGGFVSSAVNSINASAASLTFGEREDFSHVRDYILGDMIQQVHWKLTAKQDELMIKQYDEITDRRTLVLCDYGAENGESGIMQRSDGIIETAIAFTMSAAEAGISTTVDFGSVDRSLRCNVSDMAGFDRFYELMAVLPARMEVMEFSDLIKGCDKYSCSVIFLVTGRLTEELILEAERLAEGFHGTVVLAYVNFTFNPIAEQAEDKRFVFLNILGEADDALNAAAEQLSFKK